MFRKLLIANRGEIALRVARTCREMGIRTVAVHSERDRRSAAVAAADEAVQIGPPAPARSYLNAAAVLEAALQTGAEAIHPGYGFLSESADFAEACESLGITLVGPPAAVMAELGDKARARALMAGAGLPLLPGTLEPVGTAEAEKAAAEVGFPLIVKASAGGGGRAMQVVRDPASFGDAFRHTGAAARALFGDGRVYIERFLEGARHVEVQVVADTHGTVADLGERDCTVQRRHQKLVEESPAPLAPAVAEQVRRSALAGAEAAGYVGAGTFEFLVGPDGSHYFMEVNCRLQVEHPVTEMVTGVDLVREQVRVAAGHRLALGAEHRPRGVAIECRVNAEDPDRAFAPSPGHVDVLVPAGGPFVRVDTHLRAGDRVPPDYDSLLAKLVVWAPDRDQALARMERALGEFRVEGDGLATNLAFLSRVLAHPRFRSATHDTALVEDLTG